MYGAIIASTIISESVKPWKVWEANDSDEFWDKPNKRAPQTYQEWLIENGLKLPCSRSIRRDAMIGTMLILANMLAFIGWLII